MSWVIIKPNDPMLPICSACFVTPDIAENHLTPDQLNAKLNAKAQATSVNLFVMHLWDFTSSGHPTKYLVLLLDHSLSLGGWCINVATDLTEADFPAYGVTLDSIYNLVKDKCKAIMANTLGVNTLLLVDDANRSLNNGVADTLRKTLDGDGTLIKVRDVKLPAPPYYAQICPVIHLLEVR
ncbi:MAG: hypothetical protein ACLQBA_00970, partial [Candidatus Binataceae bacterium]